MNKPLRILHLEDNPDYSALVRTMLAEAGLPADIQLVSTLGEFETALEAEPFDIILADHGLHTGDGMQALEIARRTKAYTPFVLVSGTIEEQIAIEVLNRGATDYVLKQWSERLVPVVRRAVQEARERSGREQAETELVRAERHYRALTENSLDVVSIVSRDGTYLYISPSLKHVLGYAPEELAGCNCFELMHPNDVSDAKRVFAQVLQNPELRATHEHRHRRRDGSWCHLESVCQNRLATPDIEGIVVNSRDITARKNAEEKFRSLMESGPDGTVILNQAGEILFVNSKTESLFGYSRQELLGEKIEILLPPHNREPHAPGRTFLFREPHARPTGAAIELQGLRKDGSEFPVEINVNPIRGEAGVLVSASVRDITERKRTEALLRLQSAALEAAANAIVITDRVGEVIWTNPAFTRITGYSRDDALGKNPRFLKSGQHDPTFYRELWRTITDGQVWTAEMVNRRKDGSLFTEEITITPVRDERDEITHFIAVKQDISERKRLESQLIQAQKMEAIGQLAGGLAHDLNNVLVPILMSVGLFREKLLDPEDQSVLAALETSAKRGADILRQLLSFGRGMGGRRSLVDPKYVIKDINRFVAETFDKSIRLEVRITDDIWPVMADPTHLHQVLLNLCLNARDAMPTGGRLTLFAQNLNVGHSYAALHPQAALGPHIVMGIRDTGSGIPPELRNRIFEPFFTTKEPSKGTGLGLSTVMTIVKSYNGFMHVESEVGGGTTIRVHLPALPDARVKPAPAEEAAPPRGHGETVLVVDDEVSVCEVVKKTLEKFGYHVLIAPDGEQALATYIGNQTAIAVVLTDLMMPVMDGVAAIRALQRINPNVKIIAGSGLDAEAKRDSLASLGIKHIISKPYTARTVLEELRTVLTGS